MAQVLLTGGTGTLGRAVERELVARGDRVRILSRKPRPADRAPDGWVQGDLNTGAGLSAAVDGVDTIVHCATGRGDEAATKRLATVAVEAAGSHRAADTAGVQPHLIYVSIVGVDRIPMFYYKAKLACEQVVAASGLPWTVVRATQFHDLVHAMVRAQRRLPVVLVPGVGFQPVDVRDVAAVLADRVRDGAAGRAPDVGGPEVLPAVEIARRTLRALGVRRRVQALRLPGRIFGALRDGANLAPGHAVGTRTYDEYLAEKAATG